MIEESRFYAKDPAPRVFAGDAPEQPPDHRRRCGRPLSASPSRAIARSLRLDRAGPALTGSATAEQENVCSDHQVYLGMLCAPVVEYLHLAGAVDDTGPQRQRRQGDTGGPRAASATQWCAHRLLLGLHSVFVPVAERVVAVDPVAGGEKLVVGDVWMFGGSPRKLVKMIVINKLDGKLAFNRACNRLLTL